jgi:hypothetical protein
VILVHATHARINALTHNVRVVGFFVEDLRVILIVLVVVVVVVVVVTVVAHLIPRRFNLRLCTTSLLCIFVVLRLLLDLFFTIRHVVERLDPGIRHRAPGSLDFGAHDGSHVPAHVATHGKREFLHRVEIVATESNVALPVKHDELIVARADCHDVFVQRMELELARMVGCTRAVARTNKTHVRYDITSEAR